MAPVGTVVGASAAAIAAIGTSIVIPGLGWVVAGPLVAALAGGFDRTIFDGGPNLVIHHGNWPSRPNTPF
jgi:hypothetical protein